MITIATFADARPVCDNRPMDANEYLNLIRDAKVYDVAIKSPLERANLLSTRTNNTILMKREDLQPVFSFKLRGAYNKIATLSDDQTTNGVICSSAGNHAQGVALAAQKRGIRAVIVMPVTTPSIKVDAVRALGGEVVLFGDAYDDAYQHARKLESQQGLVFIHPFDDAAVIAGQGTIGAEILQQQGSEIDAVFVPIGGGGLIAGIATYIKQLHPDIRIVGVEPVDSAAMRDSIAAGAPVSLDHVGIFADGVAVRRVGDETFRLCELFVDEIITVDTDQCCAAIRDIFEDTRSIVEPAGGLAVAGAKKYINENNISGQTLITISCGANVNFDRLRHIAERAAIGDQTEMLVAAEIPEEPGSFRRFCETLGKKGITEFNYRYADANKAHIFVGVQLKGDDNERAELLQKIAAAGFPTVDLSDNELAKLHTRHMVGGRPGDLKNERIFRFEFPERPGALLDFLKAIGANLNISLFHYRNHGSDHGRVLAGIEVPENESDALQEHLEKLGYAYWEESANPAYKIFLS